jgi:hypothetical protein
LVLGVSAPWFNRISEEDHIRVDCERFIGVATGLVAATLGMFAEEGQRPIFRVKVDMVVLSFTVTDSKGHYVNGLKPGNFRILEDGIVQKIADDWLCRVRKKGPVVASAFFPIEPSPINRHDARSTRLMRPHAALKAPEYVTVSVP